MFATSVATPRVLSTGIGGLIELARREVSAPIPASSRVRVHPPDIRRTGRTGGR